MDTTVNIDGVSVKVDSDIVAEVVREAEFCIGEDVHVLVNIYQDDDAWMMTSWLNGTEELNTVDITDQYSESMGKDEVIQMMEAFVHENEEYILDIAEWDDDEWDDEEEEEEWDDD